MAKKSPCVGVISLGCPKNLVDTEKMLGRFIQHGYTLTPNAEEADILMVNTCGFKADAEAESREAILAMAAIKARHPGKRLVVTGCLSQRYGDQLAEEMPEIDLLTGSDHYDQLIQLIESKTRLAVQPATPTLYEKETPRLLTTPPHTAYVKIAEGCNNPCAFCIIPQLRGRFRSRLPEDIQSEVNILCQQGVKEINLVSQDTTLYGRDLTTKTDLASLIQRLATIDDLVWIRTLYLYPTLITPTLLKVMAETEKVLPYLDVPLQHSHSDVLARMRRVERTKHIEQLLEQIHHHLPNATRRTTFIVGFPGETEKEFQHLYDFVAKEKFDHVGVFTYSDEEGTTAFTLPNKIPPEVAQEREEALMLLQQDISRDKLASQRGTTIPVLVDGVSEESEWLMEGRTMGQAPEVDGMVFINDGMPSVGTIVPVTITDSHLYDLVGHVANNPTQ